MPARRHNEIERLSHFADARPAPQCVGKVRPPPRPPPARGREQSRPTAVRQVTDDQLLRYSRHILLDEIGIEGQAKLMSSHAASARWVMALTRTSGLIAATAS